MPNLDQHPKAFTELQRMILANIENYNENPNQKTYQELNQLLDIYREHRKAGGSRIEYISEIANHVRDKINFSELELTPDVLINTR